MCEIRLGTYFTMRSFMEVRAHVAEVKRKKVLISMRARLVLMKTALRMSNSDVALVRIVDALEDLKDMPEGELADLRKAETNAQHNYDMLEQSLEDLKAADGKRPGG